MPSLFSRLKARDGLKLRKKGAHADQANLQPAQPPRWEDAWTRTTVEPSEINELVHRCTEELKSRALDHPFLLLPFRPTSNPSAVRTFVRHFFDADSHLYGDYLAQELRMTEVMVISGVIKWCWSRLSGGVIGWECYELFKVGEQDANMARDSFKTFIPLSVTSQTRASIIFNFFDLLSAITAHGKANGFVGRKLARLAGWWAFEHKDTGSGFDGGYKSWLRAADATSHLFFAYLRSLEPYPNRGAISMLPISLQKLLQETEYPPIQPPLILSRTYRVVMIVDSVSPTPFSLLRRANHFQYREDDCALQKWSEYEDPIKALTDECCRVLKAISAANQSHALSSSKHSTGLRDASWSRFEDVGFSSALHEDEDDGDGDAKNAASRRRPGLYNNPISNGELGRPTTPSWADFLSSGFVDDGQANHFLPPDKVLPPLKTQVRQRSSQSHGPRLEGDHALEPGELASISQFDLDDAFWWVWMSSLAPEETAMRKSAFGRCAVIETVIRAGRWLVMEEMVKGAEPELDQGAYIAEKKGFFSWTRRHRSMIRGKTASASTAASGTKHDSMLNAGASKTSIAPEQHARIQAAALQLQARDRQIQQQQRNSATSARRGRTDQELMAEKTSSIMTLQPDIMSSASPAIKWANRYDKETVREAYLANSNAGRGLADATMLLNRSAASNSPSPASYAHVEATMPVSPPPQSPVSPTVERSFRIDNPLPPLPLDEPTHTEVDRTNMVSPCPEPLTPSSPPRKGKPSGLRKLFARSKSRHSSVPDNAANELRSMGVHPELTPAPTPEPHLPIVEEDYAPEPQVALEAQPSEHVTDDVCSPLEKTETMTSQFNQGPLEDQPAFVLEEDLELHPVDEPSPQTGGTDRPPPPSADSAVASEASPSLDKMAPAPDRWAQIRRNAAERALQRQSTDVSGGSLSKSATTLGDSDAGGEDTIEARVAKIKARVAQITNAETSGTAPLHTMSSRPS